MPKSRRILSKLAIGCMIAAVLPLPAALFVPSPQVDAFIRAASAGIIALLALALVFGIIARRPVRGQVPADTIFVDAEEVAGLATSWPRQALPAVALTLDEATDYDDWDQSTRRQLEALVRAGRRP